MIDQSIRIAFIQSSWHSGIVDRGRASFIAEMAALGFAEDRIDCFTVPGALEIPFYAQRLAISGIFAAIVGCGLVVDGGIYRHEFVADAVVSGLMQVQLTTDVPVLSVVLTPHHFHGSAEHVAFFGDHFTQKGAEAARSCVELLASLEHLASIISPQT